MAKTETNWIFNLIESVTAPMKKITASIFGAQEAIDGVTDAVQFNEKETKEALKNEEANRKSLIKKIKEQELAVKELEKQKSLVAPGAEWAKVASQLDRANEKLADYRQALKGSEADIKDLEKSLKKFLNNNEGWENAITGINQFAELAEKAVDSLDFASEFNNLQVNIQRMTGATGDELDLLASESNRLAKVYNEDADEIARAANATAKQMEISFTDALSLIDQGFQKGANLNGDMLDQMKEYAPQMLQAGISASEGMAIMAKAAQEGIYSDKAIDAIKEAGLSLNEMGKSQVDALKGIGIEVKDLAGKTTFEAVQMISEAMKGATVQARQLALADIFKGAGEDAGLGFIMGLSAVDMNLENIPSVKQANEGLNSWMANIQSMFATTFGGATAYVQSFAIGATGLMSVISIVQTLSKVTWLQNIAGKAATATQWLWNAALTANPIGVVIVSVAALAAGVVYCWNQFEGFRSTIYGLWEVFKQIFENISGLFSAVFAPVMEAFTAIQNGDWTKAAEAVLKLNPVSMGVRAGEYIASGGLTEGVGEAWERGSAKGKDDKENDAFSIDKAVTGNGRKATVLDGIVAPDQNKDKKGKSGMSIDGSGGGKAITMNLDIKNYFNVSSDMDVNSIADKIFGLVNDRLRDALV